MVLLVLMGIILIGTIVYIAGQYYEVARDFGGQISLSPADRSGARSCTEQRHQDGESRQDVDKSKKEKGDM